MSAGWEVVFGLECHAQLACRSKLFCGCVVDAEAAPNESVCPICLAHPGTLPRLNGEAVTQAVRAALALSCTVHPVSRFSRKHYFYPDLPKGYQITQGEQPLATGGRVHVGDRTFGITRIHLEEDAGRMLHTPEGSRVDWNRAGVPLIEIVGAPDVRSPAEAEGWLRTVHRVLVTAGVCLGDLEKGHFRCDANVSLRRPGGPPGTRVELKNLNSFRFVARALQAEVDRQMAVVTAGGEVKPETRSWAGNKTVALRSKETASDYRPLPEPDLPPLRVDEAELHAAAAALPGVPLDLHLAAADRALRADWMARHGLGAADVEALLGAPEAAAIFAEAVAAGSPPRGMADLVKREVLRRLNEGGLGQLGAAHLVEVAALLAAGKVHRDGARALCAALDRDGGTAAAALARLGLAPLADEGALQVVVRDVVARHPDELARYRAGNKGLQGFFIGQVMSATRRQADPKLAARLVREVLEGVS